MIHVFIGDTDAVRDSFQEEVKKNAKKGTLYQFDDETFDQNELLAVCEGQELFGGISVISLRYVCRGGEDREKFIVRQLKTLSESPHVFIFLEESLPQALREKFKKHASFYKEQKQEKKSVKGPNLFALTDALGRRDRKKLWVEYQRAIQGGFSPEEIHGMLFWQIKSMLLAENTAGAEEAGMNPFPYRKARGFLKHFSNDELRALSGGLLDLYRDARRGTGELSIALEQFVLSI